MANKIIKIPVTDIEGLRSDGGYSFRYRIVSKDGNRKSEWSDVSTLQYNTDLAFGNILSFYESQGDSNFGRPGLYYYDITAPPLFPNPNNYLDPHTLGLAYSPAQVFNFVTPGIPITSSITISEDTDGVLNYSWGTLENLPNPGYQKFDVYLSYKDSTGWGNWIFAGTTTSNNFSFTSPNVGQYVQAAVFLSSYPKLDNIYNQPTNFVSISSAFNAYRSDTSATITVISAAGNGTKAQAQIDLAVGSEPFPTIGFSQRRVYADTATFGDRNGFGEAKVTVKSRSNSLRFIVESNVNFTAGTIYNVSLV